MHTMAAADAEDITRRTYDSVRRTYELLVNVRSAQLKYMQNRRRETKEFAFLVTPDLVLQYNYVHQLMKSFYTTVPPDMCAEDGGITCSNLSVFRFDRTTGAQLRSFAKPAPVADGSDYLAGRIVDLLDRPVTVGDQDLTVNVRDEFAANIRALNLLFEDRLQRCNDQSGQLRNELSTVRSQLEASRTASAEATARSVADRTVQGLREQIVRYEAQLRVVREQMESLREINETAVRRNQAELEELVRRMNNTTGQTEQGDTLLRLLRRVFDGMDAERERVLSAVQQIQQYYDLRSDQFSRQLQQTRQDQKTTPPTPCSADEIERRVQHEVAVRLKNQVGDFESRVDRETSGRVTALESSLRVKIHEQLETEMRTRFTRELDTRTEELKRRFDDEVASRVAQVLNAGPVSVVTSEQILATDTCGPVAFKTTLDKIFALKESVLSSIVPMRPQYELPARSSRDIDHEVMHVLYGYVEHLLQKLRDSYAFCKIQSGYLYNLGATARSAGVKLDSMDAERAAAFDRQVEAVMNEGLAADRTQSKGVRALLDRLSKDLERLKAEFERFYREKSFYGANEKAFKQKEEELSALRRRLEKTCAVSDVDATAKRRRDEAEMHLLRAAAITDRTTIRELRNSLSSFIDEKNSKAFGTPDVMTLDAELKRQVSLNVELAQQFRNEYNSLANYALDVVERMKHWFAVDSGGVDVPSVLLDCETALNGIMKKADAVINYSESPRLVSKHFEDLHNRIAMGARLPTEREQRSPLNLLGELSYPSAATAADLRPRQERRSPKKSFSKRKKRGFDRYEEEEL